MHIAIIIENITKRAGTERAVVSLANMLVNSNKYNVTIFSVDSKSGDTGFELANKVDIKHFGLNTIERSKIRKIRQYIFLYKRLRDLKKQKDIDIIIGTYSLYNALLTIGRKYKKKIIGWEHFAFDGVSRFHKILRKRFYKKLNAVVVLTNNDALKYGFIPNSKLYVIPNVASFVSTTFAELNNKTIVSLGRLANEKGFDRLIEIAKVLKDKIPDYKIQIYGEGKAKQNLLNMIADYNLSDFVFINHPVSDVQSVYKNASLYVLPSRYESFGLVLLEAMTCGVPCVAFDCPSGPRELIDDGQNGFLVPDNDIELMAEKIVLIASDYQLRKTMQSYAIKKASEFSGENIFLKWHDLFLGL